MFKQPVYSVQFWYLSSWAEADYFNNRKKTFKFLFKRCMDDPTLMDDWRIVMFSDKLPKDEQNGRVIFKARKVRFPHDRNTR